ncbi:MAG: tRNA-(ms[2]io[6]A)-hydroxylase [Pseudohongiellaceae bacterium]|jgi:tRNA-(ms[2]io[6]A)-hydroxylase
MTVAPSSETILLEPIHNFLCCETPLAWLQAATESLPELLIDHANCEKKAAATAMNLMYRYTQRPDLLKKMSQLAREELLHFQQVVELMEARGIIYTRLSPSRYAASLRQLLATDQDTNLVDTLIVGALIEARSCERFAKLAPLLDAELSKFYRSLLKSEARHFEDYLALAQLYSRTDITQKVKRFAQFEAELITSPDDTLRFHSGVPVNP